VDRRRVDSEEVRRGVGGAASATGGGQTVSGAGGVEAKSLEKKDGWRMDGGGRMDNEDD
jgi:hypothetical protein